MLDTHRNRTTTAKLIEALALSYLMLFHFVRVGILWVGMCLIAITAHAQQDAIGSMATPATSAAGGWWSQDRSESTLAIPQLNLRTAKFARLAVPELPPVSWTHESSYPGVEYPTGWRPRQGGFDLLLDTRRQDEGPLQDEELRSGSFFSLFNAKYIAWEANISDSGSLTNVNGALLHPLVEIEFGHWRLPITLYIPPLRGSVSR